MDIDFDALRASYNRKSTLVLDVTGRHPWAEKVLRNVDKATRMRMLTQEYVFFFYLDVKKIHPDHRDKCAQFQRQCEELFLRPLRAILTEGDEKLAHAFDQRVASLKLGIDKLDYFVESEAVEKLCQQLRDLELPLSLPVEELREIVQTHNLTTGIDTDSIDDMLHKDQEKQHYLVAQFFIYIYLNEKDRLEYLNRASSAFLTYHRYLNKLRRDHGLSDLPFHIRKRYEWTLSHEMGKLSPVLNNLIQTALTYQKYRDQALELSESLSFESLREKSRQWKRLEELVVPWLQDPATYARIKSNYWLSIPFGYVPPDPNEYLALIALGFATDRKKDVDRLYAAAPNFSGRLQELRNLRDRVFDSKASRRHFPSQIKAFLKTMKEPAFLQSMTWTSSTAISQGVLSMSLNVHKTKGRIQPVDMAVSPEIIKKKDPAPAVRDAAILNAFALGYFAVLTKGEVLKTQGALEIATQVNAFLDNRDNTWDVPHEQKDAFWMLASHFKFLSPYAVLNFLIHAKRSLIREWEEAPWRQELVAYARPVLQVLAGYNTLFHEHVSRNELYFDPESWGVSSELPTIYQHLGRFEMETPTVELPMTQSDVSDIDESVETLHNEPPKPLVESIVDSMEKPRGKRKPPPRRRKSSTNDPVETSPPPPPLIEKMDDSSHDESHASHRDDPPLHSIPQQQPTEKIEDHSIKHVSSTPIPPLAPPAVGASSSHSEHDASPRDYTNADSSDERSSDTIHIHETYETPRLRRIRKRSRSPESIPFIRLPTFDPDRYMYPGRDEGIRSGKEAYEQMPRAHPTYEEKAEQRLRQMTHEWEQLQKDPTYAETHVTSFPEINMQVALARVRRARAIADREEREEANKQYHEIAHSRAEDVRRRLREEEETAAATRDRTNTSSWSNGQWFRSFRTLYQ
jgi:hypothetical protein